MTLIAYIATQHYVVLLSDRRVTVTVANKVESQEDASLKTSLIGSQYLMGYTGAALPGGQSMETWLGSHLNAVPNDEMPAVIQRAIQAEFDSNKSLSALRHTFVLVGFRVRPNSVPVDYETVVRFISNCIDADGNEGALRPNFEIVEVRLGNRKQIVGSVGAPVKGELMETLRKRVRICLKTNSRDPQHTFNSIVELAAQVAAGSGGWVGDVFLVTSVPKRAVPVFKWLIPGTRDSTLPESKEMSVSAVYFTGAAPIFGEKHIPGMYWETGSAFEVKMKKVE